MPSSCFRDRAPNRPEPPLVDLLAAGLHQLATAVRVFHRSARIGNRRRTVDYLLRDHSPVSSKPFDSKSPTGRPPGLDRPPVHGILLLTPVPHLAARSHFGGGPSAAAGAGCRIAGCTLRAMDIGTHRVCYAGWAGDCAATTAGD